MDTRVFARLRRIAPRDWASWHRSRPAVHDRWHISAQGWRRVDFASTLFHECSHATIHPSRLNRKNERTKDGYATEELVAELSSAFVCAALGYSYNAAQSPAYIGGWLKVLKADSRAIVSLSSQASKVADWMLQKGHGADETRPEHEQPKVDDAIPY